ncbi:MAG: putative toxin-antitoxin system toxin component, PIN family [bacterium]
MRVVVDTNVFISSFFGGNPRRVIDLWSNGDITLCFTREIIQEYVEVLERLGLREDEGLSDILSLFARGFNCLFTTRTPDLEIVADDPDDDKFIECAVALKADCVITGDKALLAVEKYMNIEITTPARFLEHFEEA